MNVKLSAALVASLALVLAGCSSGPTPAETRASAAALREAMQVEIRYEVEGERLSYGDKMPYADVTMQTPTGTSQSSPDLPMGTEDGRVGLMQTFAAGAFVYLSVQNNGSTNDVTCRITGEAGQVISENTSSSQYGIASCKGQAR